LERERGRVRVLSRAIGVRKLPKPLTLVLSPCPRGEARKADVWAAFLKTDNQRTTTGSRAIRTEGRVNDL
jgi:hypothetical protein